MVYKDRITTEITEPITVFLIGMRVNKLLPLSRWLKVARAMPPMIETLMKHPDKGMLHGESFFRLGPLTTILVSYWKSPEHLENFARNPNDPHLKAWQEFYKLVGTDGSVGIWHETYVIQPDQVESVYANMPMFGLVGATKNAIPAKGHRSTFRKRLLSRETVKN
ncbi:DUF4188 domain-containing protein [Deinococcus roseus]|uniref:Transcriptional regulator n=1 Tax=Deinococcus roseus TaxID=392414 RepID=A0ABQ2CV69_9DEIO|nr:DUF4188 domain-containing protein [Deinococcus roseus]GGJ23584.1 transcriptional regulator [Deinococcus roseus]